MLLTKSNIEIYGAKHYDNHSCISKEEFLQDLNMMSTIKRMVCKYINGGHTVNLRLLVNNVITFYNCFEHHAATNLIDFKLEEKEKPFINSILIFLSLPEIDKYGYDAILLNKIEEEIK